MCGGLVLLINFRVFNPFRPVILTKIYFRVCVLGRALRLSLSSYTGYDLRRLAHLAINAGFDWVYHAKNYIHVSVVPDSE